MSVETGISPRELLELDGATYDALRRELSLRWTPETELLAASAEIAHAHLLAYLRVNAKRGTKLPEPLVVERPKREEEKKRSAPVVSVAELALIGGSGVERVGVVRGR